MPCDSINLTAVDLDVVDRDLLEKALFEMGCQVMRQGKKLLFLHPDLKYWVTVEEGTATIRRGDEAIVAKVKKAYSEQVLKKVKSRFAGWTTKQVKENKYEFSRRY